MNTKLEVDCSSFGPPGRKSQLEISSKDGASSSISAKSLKFKLKGRKRAKSSLKPSQALVQAHEPEKESREEPDDEDEDEGEVMIISPLHSTNHQGPSIQEIPFQDVVDDDVDSFSIFFTPTILASKGNTLALLISSTTPILTTE